MGEDEADRMAHALDALADAVGLTGRHTEIEYLAEVTRRVVALRARAEAAERGRDEALVAEHHMNVERDEAIMDGLRYKRQRDEARAERDAARRLLGEAREVIARMIACTASAAHPDAKWAAEIGRRFFQEREEAGGG